MSNILVGNLCCTVSIEVEEEEEKEVIFFDDGTC